MKKEKFKSVLGIIVIISMIAFLTVSCGDGPSGGSGGSGTPPTSILDDTSGILTYNYPAEANYTTVGLPARIKLTAAQIVTKILELVEGDAIKGVDINPVFENYVGYGTNHDDVSSTIMFETDELFLVFGTTGGLMSGRLKYFNGMVGWLEENLELKFHKEETEDGSLGAKASWTGVKTKTYYVSDKGGTGETDPADLNRPAGTTIYYTETYDLFTCTVIYNRADIFPAPDVIIPAYTLMVYFKKETSFITGRVPIVYIPIP
jgi:hypothetical protein